MSFSKMDGCGSRCIKRLLIIFNGLFMIFGIVLISAAWKDMGMIQDIADMQTGHETDAVLIAVGVLIIIVAAFGCLGAWRESPKLLYIFAGFLIIIILLELSVGIAAAALRPQIEDSWKTNLRISFIRNKSYRVEDIDYRVYWDRVQSNLQCCGITGPDNYINQAYWNQAASHPTYSCCPPDNSEKSVEIKRADCISATAYYKEGCEDKMLSSIHSAGLIVIVCGILFCFLEVAGVVLALRLAFAIKPQGKSQVA